MARWQRRLGYLGERVWWRVLCIARMECRGSVFWAQEARSS